MAKNRSEGGSNPIGKSKAWFSNKLGEGESFLKFEKLSDIFGAKFFWIFFLVFIYIFYNLIYENRIRRKTQIGIKIDSIKAAYIFKQSDLGLQTKKSIIQKNVQKLGLDENTEAPQKIVKKE
jgi:hypothetical protein